LESRCRQDSRGKEKIAMKMFQRFFVVAVTFLYFGLAMSAQQGMWTVAVNMPIAATATASGCYTPLAGTTNWCRTGTGTESVSINGATYVQVWPATAAAGTVKTVNKVAPGPNGDVSCPAGVTPATPAPFSSTTPLVASVPAMTAAAGACLGS
jgi:hypothetical protein